MPSDKYVKWLQAHPAVCEALQEHELECWDFFMWEGDVYVVTAVGCDGVYANKHDTSRDWFNTEEDLAGRSMWLPTLGQLVRLLSEVCGSIEHDSIRLSRWSYKGDYSVAIVVTRCSEDSYPYASDEDEPEIACTALWAKVEGV